MGAGDEPRCMRLYETQQGGVRIDKEAFKFVSCLILFGDRRGRRCRRIEVPRVIEAQLGGANIDTETFMLGLPSLILFGD